MNKTTLVGIAVIMLVAIGGYMYSQSSTQSPSSAQNQEANPTATTNSNTAYSAGSAGTSNTNDSMPVDSDNDTDSNDTPSLARYQEYTPELAASASDDQDVVLFFHASWCPTCKVANREFTENTDQIPEDVLVLKTDYDTQTELKQKYGVNYQHTFVQIDSEGNQIKQWNGGGLDQLISRVE